MEKRILLKVYKEDEENVVADGTVLDANDSSTAPVVEQP